jgi:hypothetical protein
MEEDDDKRVKMKYNTKIVFRRIIRKSRNSNHLILDKIRWGSMRQSCTQNGERTDNLHLTEVKTGSVGFATALALI